MSKDSEWEDVKSTLPIGSHVTALVCEHQPFGAFARIEGVPFVGLIQITDMRDTGRVEPKYFPPVGTIVNSVVLGHRDSNHQIWLGIKESQVTGEYDRAKVLHEAAVPIGIRFENGRLKAFGFDRVNSYIACGASVVQITGESAIFLKSPPSDGKVQLGFSGFTANVIVRYVGDIRVD